ncbi:hypothetical protein GpartN1_g1801.t1 [Galdieria partita]|uniref:Tetratricopeptide repeat protein n=1 Tax=Galdieria partita TaxID=83374 RepID=A0A9C7PT85_9RHOD|nr:hypothetical protein GpartN1_g1801.t1 [Galdieria partita]
MFVESQYRFSRNSSRCFCTWNRNNSSFSVHRSRLNIPIRYKYSVFRSNWIACGKRGPFQCSKRLLKNVAFLLAGSVVVYSGYIKYFNIGSCSEMNADISHINFLSDERQAQREKSLENSKITGSGAKIFARAKKLAELKDFSSSEQLYQQLIQEEPTFAPAYSNLANIQIIFGRNSQAITNYTRALELAPLSDDTWIIYLNRANTWIALGDIDKAAADIEQAAQLKPKDPLILSTRAFLLSYEGKWDAAFTQYQSAVDSRPNEVQPFWFNYGMLWFEKGKPFEARSIIYRVAQKYPKQSDIHVVLAGIEFSGGDIEAAESQWKLVEYPKKYTPAFIEKEKKWPPKVRQAVESFIEEVKENDLSE